jgi:hypothetical protein
VTDITKDKYYDNVVLNRKGSANLVVGGTLATALIAAPIGSHKISKVVAARRNKIVKNLWFPAAVFGYLGIVTLGMVAISQVDKVTTKLYKKRLMSDGSKQYYVKKLAFINNLISSTHGEIKWVKSEDVREMYIDELGLDRYNKELKQFINQLHKLNIDKKQTIQKIASLK